MCELDVLTLKPIIYDSAMLMFEEHALYNKAPFISLTFNNTHLFHFVKANKSNYKVFVYDYQCFLKLAKEALVKYMNNPDNKKIEDFRYFKFPFNFAGIRYEIVFEELPNSIYIPIEVNPVLGIF